MEEQLSQRHMTDDERTHALQRNVTQLQQQLSDLHEQLAAEGRRSNDWQQQLADSRAGQLAQVLHVHMIKLVSYNPYPLPSLSPPQTNKHTHTLTCVAIRTQHFRCYCGLHAHSADEYFCFFIRGRYRMTRKLNKNRFEKCKIIPKMMYFFSFLVQIKKLTDSLEIRDLEVKKLKNVIIQKDKELNSHVST